MRIWRLIEDIPRTGSFNMAADQLLLENYSLDANPVFRIYDWECTTLSLGRNEILDNQLIWMYAGDFKSQLSAAQRAEKLFYMVLT